ncbi:MAG: hypothetical protein QOI98_2595, partial [Solirubrobacteraceae bacterium]|nr:hypothetical protein [Solirubrobacteraceae bacterium]
MRGFIAALAVLCLGFAGCGGGHARRSSSPQPNVIVIETDDQDAASLRHMPQVQRLLVKQGTTFRN